MVSAPAPASADSRRMDTAKYCTQARRKRGVLVQCKLSLVHASVTHAGAREHAVDEQSGLDEPRLARAALARARRVLLELAVRARPVEQLQRALSARQRRA